ncbi:hypothetical protein [Desulfonatronum thioautotrophicum]|uniref:hypothetical protein n=1 Tax=Desulfonatronum thioautotrophicum TaxID=617001 RepID=UPI0012947A3E|nr:hypothetical protein [Desulfonatronum thioautotrophicum]
MTASLFAALFRALAHCPEMHHATVLAPLESRLGQVVHGLHEKFAMLLAPACSEQDTIQGLWLLYLTMRFHDQDGPEMWIGPDLFSDAAEAHSEPHLRIHGLQTADAGPAHTLADLRESLEILARSIRDSARVALYSTGPQQLVAVLEDEACPR